MRRHAMGALLGLIASGCLVGEVQDIPCTADDECATAHFCDLTIGTCRAELDGATAPRLEVAGVAVDGGDVQGTLSLDGDGVTTLEVVLVNAGGVPAVDVALALQAPRCLTLLVDEATLPDGVVAGGRARVDVTASADGTCTEPLDVDWSLSFSGREAVGSFSFTLD